MLRPHFKKIKFTIIVTMLFLATALTSASAQIFSKDLVDKMNKQSGEFQKNSGFANTSLGGVVASIIEIFLGLLGIIFTSLIIYAGYLWMTARGNEERVTRAQDIFKSAVWGLAITLSAYAINYFVITYLTASTVGTVEFGAG